MKRTVLLLALTIPSFGAIAGESMGCIWVKAKLETAIEMQADYEEKQEYYVKENGKKSQSYEIGLEMAKEDEREARAEIPRKCE